MPGQRSITSFFSSPKPKPPLPAEAIPENKTSNKKVRSPLHNRNGSPPSEEPAKKKARRILDSDSEEEENEDQKPTMMECEESKEEEEEENESKEAEVVVASQSVEKEQVSPTSAKKDVPLRKTARKHMRKRESPPKQVKQECDSKDLEQNELEVKKEEEDKKIEQTTSQIKEVWF
ncbi:histone H3.v1-like [Strongylocentrotus purpuratus]|uniref:DNA ligase 1-like n=1 Tax=Strongylocentrotus purpuratus TaxID=7668 RepID=A0A7M7NT38_STRPU|nr:histone H3.v1-like [Strongylocentrotus purpuratus]